MDILQKTQLDYGYRMFTEQIYFNGRFPVKQEELSWIPMYSPQLALQTALEGLGSRGLGIPVVLSITSPPDTFAAVLRAGALPCVLDINEDTLSYSIKDLQVLAEDHENGFVVVHEYPHDDQVSDWLEDNDLVEVKMHRVPPTHTQDKGKYQAPVNIFSMELAWGWGAALETKFKDLELDFRTIGHGLLGLGSVVDFREVRHRLGLRDIHAGLSYASEAYYDFLWDPDGDEYEITAIVCGPPFPLVRVANAKETIARLALENIEARPWYDPLHTVESLKHHWPEGANYPFAENLQNRIVALPMWPGMRREHVERIVNHLE